jgi:hypothetical protein
MQKITLLTKGLTNKDVQAAMQLAVQAGISQGVATSADVGPPDPACDDEVVLLVMTPGLSCDPDLENQLKQAANGGRRAICIWPADATDIYQLPASVTHYAYSIIPWNAEKLSAVAADDDVMCRESPDGVAMPKVEMQHNCCVEEKAKSA